MLRALRLTSVLLAGLALPVLAQTPSSQPGGGRSTPPATTSRPAPAAPAPGTAPRAPAASTSATPAPTTATPSARGGTTPSATTPAATAATQTGGKIDINSASAQELDTLPGVGPALAQQIIAGRPWDDLNDLVKKKALPQGVFDRNKDRLALANINTSSAADMAKTLPGIGEVRSRAIVSGRPYSSPQDLVGKHVLSQNQFAKIKDLVAY